MQVVGLFAGIGGLERGLAAAGHDATMLCEVWDPARAVLNHRFPGIHCETDVRSLRSLPKDTDLLTAGFPCQDLSQAGMTAGIGGKRSGLVGEIFRLLDDHPVPWVLLENVSFMLQLERGRAMDALARAFEERGYRWAYRVVNSLSFLPQRRERVLFLATRSDVDPASVVLTDEAEPQLASTDLDARAHGFYWTEGLRGLGWAPDAIPTLKNGSTVGIASPPAILRPDGSVVTPDIRDAERLQGFPEGWTEAAEGVAKASLRWSLIGNAVTVPVAEWLGSRLADPGSYESERDQDFSQRARWPRAARFDGSQRHAVEINGYPQWKNRSPLVSFLRYPGKPLSARATKGFLSRTYRAKLRFPIGFQDRLREHLSFMEATHVDRERAFAVAAE
jgi:DNA (cytosine-5)-methyltransferase 1